MRLLFTCGREPQYIRNQLVLGALRDIGDVIEITSETRNGAVRFARILSRLWRQREGDLNWIGFLGHPLMLLHPPRWRNPLIFDAFISILNTVCDDRQWFSAKSPLGRLARWIDIRACESATLVVVDTEAHARYFHEALGVPVEKLRVLHVGCDERVFMRVITDPCEEPPISVFTYGSFQPLHGMEVVVAAAKRLDPQEYRVVIGGNGAGAKRVRRMATRLAVTNLRFTDWIPFESLSRHIAEAGVCLSGPFGKSVKAQLVVPTKTYQFMAMGRAIIATNTAANREVLQHMHSALMIAPDDPQALADAIRVLGRDAELRHTLGANARNTFLQRFSNAPRLERIRALLDELK